MKVVVLDPTWQARVLQFRARVYPHNHQGNRPAHFRWRFLEGPLPDPPLYLLAVEGEQVLGQWAGLPDRVWSRGRSWPVVWMVDLVVAPEHRDTMAAAALFRAAMATGRSLLATGAPAAMLPFYQVFRWQRLAVADTFYQVFRPSRALRLAEAAPSGLPTLALPLADRLLPAAHALRARWPRPSVPVEPLPAFGVEIDRLFSRLRDRLGVCCERGGAWLTWKFSRRPVGQHLALAARHDDGSLRGYAVVKLRHRPGVARWAELADFLVDPEDGPAFDALVDAGCRAARAAGVDFVRLRCSLPAQSTRLRPPWWIRRVRSPIDDLFVLGGADPAAGAALADHPWSITAAASDTIDTGLDEWEETAPAWSAPPG